MWALVKEATRETTRLIDFAKAFQNHAYARNKAEGRNLQTIWRSVRIDEANSLSKFPLLYGRGRCRTKSRAVEVLAARFTFACVVSDFCSYASSARITTFGRVSCHLNFRRACQARRLRHHLYLRRSYRLQADEN